MRLYNYLNEAITDDVVEAVKIIQRDCKPYLDACGPHPKPLFRGYAKRIETIEKITPRTDRRPKNTNPKWHEYLDQKFQRKFGWRARSEGVFATNNYGQAEAYSHKPGYFFPIGEFKYIWSDEIYDLFIEIDELEDDCFMDTHSEGSYKDCVTKGVDSMIATYVDKDFISAINSGHEIMFKCDSYYLMNVFWFINIPGSRKKTQYNDMFY